MPAARCRSPTHLDDHRQVGLAVWTDDPDVEGDREQYRLAGTFLQGDAAVGLAVAEPSAGAAVAVRRGPVRRGGRVIRYLVDDALLEPRRLERLDVVVYRVPNGVGPRVSFVPLVVAGGRRRGVVDRPVEEGDRRLTGDDWRVILHFKMVPKLQVRQDNWRTGDGDHLRQNLRWIAIPWLSVEPVSVPSTRQTPSFQFDVNPTHIESR